MKSNAPRIAGIILSLLGISLLAYGVHLAIAPNVYQSAVRIKAEKDMPEISSFAGERVSFEWDPYWIQTEFEKIQSKVILYPVISNLNLNKVWAERLKADRDLRTDETYQILKSRMDVRQARNTALIAISVQSQDPVEAAAIANGVAEEYRRQRLAIRQELELKSLATYTNEFNRLEQKIQSLEREAISGAEGRGTNDVQKELEKLKKNRERLQFRIIAERVDKTLPRSGVVEIIDRAEPSLYPIYPNKYKMGAAFCLGTVSLAFGLVLFRKGSTVSGSDSE